MTDYIKREDAIKAMAQYLMDTALIDNHEASDRIEQWEGNIAAPVMSTVKAADVVEVVHCKDCKHIKEEHFNVMPDGYSCELSGLMVEPEHYCSYGEVSHE